MSRNLALLSLWAVALVLGLVLVGLIFELQSLRSRLLRVGQIQNPGPRIGSRVPLFAWRDAWTGGTFERDDLSGRTTVFVFLSTSCSLCRDVVFGISKLSLDISPLRIVLICAGKTRDCSFLCQGLRASTVLISDNGEISRFFEVSSYPLALIVDAAARVRTVKQGIRGADLEQLLKPFTERATGVLATGATV